MRQHADEPTSEGGQTWAASIMSTHEVPIASFCDRAVETMGRDISDEMLVAISLALRHWPVRLVMLERDNPEARVANRLLHDHPDDGRPRALHVLYKPGHYDALYPAGLRLRRGGEPGAALGHLQGAAEDRVEVSPQLVAEVEAATAGALTSDQHNGYGAAPAPGIFRLLGGYPRANHVVSYARRIGRDGLEKVLECAATVAPVAHRRVRALVASFLALKERQGSAVEREYYLRYSRGLAAAAAAVAAGGAPAPGLGPDGSTAPYRLVRVNAAEDGGWMRERGVRTLPYFMAYYAGSLVYAGCWGARERWGWPLWHRPQRPPRPARHGAPAVR